MTSCMPELSNDVPSLPVPQGWGLGFHLIKVDLPGMRSAGTGAWSGIFNTYYWIDRTAGVGGVIMTQVLPFFDAPHHRDGARLRDGGLRAGRRGRAGRRRVTPPAAAA